MLDDKRILIQFSNGTYEDIRRLAFEYRTSFAEIVRRCVAVGFEQVKKDLKREER